MLLQAHGYDFDMVLARLPAICLSIWPSKLSVQEDVTGNDRREVHISSSLCKYCFHSHPTSFPQSSDFLGTIFIP